MVTGIETNLMEEVFPGASVTEQASVSVYISFILIVKDTSFAQPCKWENDFQPHHKNELLEVAATLLLNFALFCTIMKIQEYYNALNLNETRQVHDCADN
jgi:hypothetical protein